MNRVVCLIIGYLFGIIQTGFIYGKINKIDIRKHGSGNAGATNALRTLGWRAGATTFFGDFLKAVITSVIIRLVFKGDESVALYVMYSGLGVVLGHNYPFYLKFKGGKGIASTVGVAFAVDPIIGLALVVIFLTIFLATKYVSLGSLTILIMFAIGVIFFGQTGKYGLVGTDLYEMYAIAIFLAVLGWWRHRENVKRLIKGAENRIDFSKIKK